MDQARDGVGGETVLPSHAWTPVPVQDYAHAAWNDACRVARQARVGHATSEGGSQEEADGEEEEEEAADVSDVWA